MSWWVSYTEEAKQYALHHLFGSPEPTHNVNMCVLTVVTEMSF